MPEIPFVQGGVIRSAGASAGGSSRGTTITSNASANTKGTVVELTSATEFDANWVLVNIGHSSNSTLSFLVDILIGASTEQVIIPDLAYWAAKLGANNATYTFPLFVPKGSRLSARCQDSTGSGTVDVSLILIAGTMLGGGQAPSWVSAYGATAGSTGTNIDPGAVANTDSAWTQITAATDRAHNWLCVGGRFGDGVLTATTDWRWSIGIGAATEQEIFGPFVTVSDQIADGPPGVVCFPCFVPAGSRLTMRTRCGVTTDGDRDINVKIYGAG